MGERYLNGIRCGSAWVSARETWRWLRRTDKVPYEGHRTPLYVWPVYWMSEVATAVAWTWMPFCWPDRKRGLRALARLDRAASEIRRWVEGQVTGFYPLPDPRPYEQVRARVDQGWIPARCYASPEAYRRLKNNPPVVEVLTMMDGEVQHPFTIKQARWKVWYHA